MLFRSIFFKSCEISRDVDLRVCKLKDGRIIIIPPKKTDAFTKEIIDPVVMDGEKVEICESCASEADDIGKLINLVKELTKQVEDSVRVAKEKEVAYNNLIASFRKMEKDNEEIKEELAFVSEKNEKIKGTIISMIDTMMVKPKKPIRKKKTHYAIDGFEDLNIG